MDKLFNHIQQLHNSLIDERLWYFFFRGQSESENLIVLQLLFDLKKYRILSSVKLKSWVMEYTNYPQWIIEKSQKIVRDNVEGLSLILPRHDNSVAVNISTIGQAIEGLEKSSDEAKKNFVFSYWDKLPFEQFYLFNRMITGLKFKEVNLKYLESGIAQFLNITNQEVNLSIYKNIKNAKGFKELFALSNAEGKLLPSLFFKLTECTLDDVKVENSRHVLYYKGTHVQLIYNGIELVCWNNEGELLNINSELGIDLIAISKQPFIIEGELCGDKNSLFFNPWQVHLGPQEIINYCHKTEKKSLSNFVEEANIYNAAGVLSIPVKTQELEICVVRTGRIHLNVVLMYAQRKGNGRSFNELTVGLKSKDQYISVGKIKMDSFEKKQATVLTQWIVKNKIQRFGPVVTVPPNIVLSVSCALVRKSARHKCGYVLDNLILSSFSKDIGLDKVDSLAILQNFVTKS